MGREIRRVPANWQHPKDDQGRFEPMRDESYITAITQWIKDHELWEKGEHPDQKDGQTRYRHFAEWGGNPPNLEYYRPDWKPEEMTWWQVYETVSEGTPVSPPFETQSELVEYLVANGDFWDQQRRKERYSGMNCDPWTRKQAERFVYETGGAPSLIMGGGVLEAGHRWEETEKASQSPVNKP